jgi:hypothetical protein
MTTFTVMSGERFGVPLLSHGDLLTEARAIDLARALVLLGGAAFAFAWPSDLHSNPARQVYLFLDRHYRDRVPERGRIIREELDR